MNWSLLPSISASMPFQMALDGLLFDLQKKMPREPFLRFYGSSSPWISAGYSFRDQNALKKSELVLRNLDVPVCRRITGGGCVLHGNDLIFSLIAPVQTTSENLGSVSASYEMIHECVKRGLQSFGLDPKFYVREDELPKGDDCFDFPVKSDLSWKGKKIAGGAQKRSSGVLLHHESIALPDPVDRGELVRALCRGVEQVFGISLRNVDLDPEMYFQAERNSEAESLVFQPAV